MGTAFLLQIPLLVSQAAQAIECSSPKQSQDTNSTHFEHQFDSGANWELCWRIDTNAGLVLENVHYTAPAEIQRRVLTSASLGQILFKYDEDVDASHLLSSPGLGGQSSVPADASQCGNGALLEGSDSASICQQTRYTNSLTQVRNKSSLNRHETSLHAWSAIGGHRYQVIWRLSEDGEITSDILFGGRLNRFTSNPAFGTYIDDTDRLASNATLLFNWRLDFDLGDNPDNDRVQEYEFPARVTDVVRRSINVRELEVETLRVVDRENFRGWRVYDNDTSAVPQGRSRIGYYLDPQGSGHNYTSRKHNWTQFDFFVTAFDECEWLASDNDDVNSGCASSLDYYTDGEFLSSADASSDVVVWYSVARHFTPSAADYPAISNRSTSFKIIPFDWSAHTPFSEPPEQ